MHRSCASPARARRSRVRAGRRRRGTRSSVGLDDGLAVRFAATRRAPTGPVREHVVERRFRESTWRIEARLVGNRSAHVGSRVSSICHIASARNPRSVAASRGKNGCQPRPNGNARASMLRMESVIVSTASVGVACSDERLRGSNANGQARAPSPTGVVRERKPDVRRRLLVDRPCALPADTVDRDADGRRGCAPAHGLRHPACAGASPRSGSSAAPADTRRTLARHRPRAPRPMPDAARRHRASGTLRSRRRSPARSRRTCRRR